MQTNPVDQIPNDKIGLPTEKGRLCHLSEFAGYIIGNHLEEFVELSIQSLRDLEVPLLSHMTRGEGDSVAARSTIEMLTHLANKDPLVHIQKAIDRWTSNQLPKVERNQIVVHDITLIAYSRKLMFLKFLPFYTRDPELIIKIAGEIEFYIFQYTSTTFQTFVGLVDDRIQDHIHQLEESQRLFNQAQGLTHIGNYVWDMENQNLLWSDELYRIYELDPRTDKITGTLARELNHPDDLDYIRKCMDEARASREPFDFYYRIVPKSGKIKILHARGEFEGGSDGSRLKIFGTCQDVTEQKETERKLLENQTFIKKIADAIPAIIASYHIGTGKYSFLSGGLKKLLGYEPQRGMEEGISFFISIIHPEDHEPLMKKNTAALSKANEQKGSQEEEIVEFEYRMRHANGEYRWFYTYGTVFSRDANGQVDQVINISLDITENVKAEQVLLQKTHELQMSNASLEEFAFVTSHDLKEPLRKISTFVDLLLALKTERNEKEERYFNKILNSTARMQQMIDNLLALSLLTNNAKPQTCDLQALLNEAWSTYEHKAETMRAQLISDKLPTAVVVDSQFRQLFQNLLGNSLKFSRTEVPPSIRVSWRLVSGPLPDFVNLKKSDQYLEIVFSDNGIGFEEMFSEKIFAIFQRLHHKEVYDGTGIGLAICKRIVNNHGGIIKAKGYPGEGATFTIVVPQ
jgi:PAS domain S-box-containing protein